MVDWVWSAAKDKRNRVKHSISFDTAMLVFLDQYALTVPDPFPDEVRLRTFGMIANQIILVVHTEPEPVGEGVLVGRIISARKATSEERRAYQDEAL